jgi:hypothetical protein
MKTNENPFKISFNNNSGLNVIGMNQRQRTKPLNLDKKRLKQWNSSYLNNTTDVSQPINLTNVNSLKINPRLLEDFNNLREEKSNLSEILDQPISRRMHPRVLLPRKNK